MSQRIIGLALAAMLAGCNAPTPPSPPVAAPTPAPVLPEPIPEPETKPAPVEEPAPAADEPSGHVDDPAVVARLRKLIDERSALGSKVFDAGVAIDGHTHAGTAFNEIHIPEHKCYVLGQLLGKADLVRPLAIDYEPDYDTQTTENASGPASLS